MKKNEFCKKITLFLAILTTSVFLISCGPKAPKPLSDADIQKLKSSITFEDTDKNKDTIGGDVSFDPGQVKLTSYASSLVFVLAENDSDKTCSAGSAISSVETKGLKAGKVGTIAEGTEYKNGSLIMLCFKNADFTEGPNTIYTTINASITDLVDKSKEEEDAAQTDTAASTEAAAAMGIELPAFDPVYFDFDKYDVGSEFLASIESKVAEVQDVNAVKVIIEGHADERGSNEYNLSLGQRRATSIKRALSNLGIPLDNIATISYGEENPVDYGHDETAWAKNRRGIILIRNSK